MALAFFLLVGVALLLGYALDWTITVLDSDTVTAFRVVVGAGLALWIAHEIVLMVHIAHPAG
ncbi:hypothetical protein SAMN05421805_105323 [Saccharopolyspora antimicrobica]|uniref:Uncharacterized protein n=1 Tax=Saccharopolyspora antimicrobica TaxID=455193 RepID=A0A1I5ABS4_9PSEU|nr:hypothetical protein [Saccharopolyspora antimicrobica]RKT83199.1 hypothetical protein ATL45_1473 [Saccharopolyspora antimicrobica]SFN59866.1 hypothetical protein SAMN05421805_105323 [Saccharopolyspora antimicrobica]